jgi:hypothetical protein
MSTEQYFCVNCNNVTTINKHGRCTTCNSEAVIGWLTPQSTASQLNAALATRQPDETLVMWANRFLDLYLPRSH